MSSAAPGRAASTALRAHLYDPSRYEPHPCLGYDEPSVAELVHGICAALDSGDVPKALADLADARRLISNVGHDPDVVLGESAALVAALEFGDDEPVAATRAVAA